MIVAAETYRPNTRHRASPRARRLLHESGLAEHEVTGTGPDGRVLRADVEAALADRNGREPEYWRENHAAAGARGVSHANTHLGPATTALAFMAVEVDFFAVERVRRAAPDAPAEHLPYIARAVLDALASYPYLNAPHGDQTVVTGRAVHLGVAVDLEPDGVSVPVIRDADSLRLRSLADRLGTAIAAARASRRSREPNSAGTFTIGNPAPYGPLLTAPPLGRRQVAALAIGAVAAKPVAIEREPGDYLVAVHPVGTLGLSFDRDVIDGGYAARFLDNVRTTLEGRDWAGEL